MAPTVKHGFWGKPTATLDWCETNYEVTPYIAEFWNTVSNFIYIIPPCIAAVQSWRQGIELRYILSYLSIVAVGCGSWLFHMTLYYHMQLLDELGMLYASSVSLYVLYETSSHPKKHNYSLLGMLGSISLIITVVYLFLKIPQFHHTCYGLMAAVMIYKSFLLSRSAGKVGKAVFVTSAICYTLAAILWNIDNVFCANLKQIRVDSGISLSNITQFHAWWHIFTGISCHLLVVFACLVRYETLKRENSLGLYKGCIPYVKSTTELFHGAYETVGSSVSANTVTTRPDVVTNGNANKHSNDGETIGRISGETRGLSNLMGIAKHSLE